MSEDKDHILLIQHCTTVQGNEDRSSSCQFGGNLIFPMQSHCATGKLCKGNKHSMALSHIIQLVFSTSSGVSTPPALARSQEAGIRLRGGVKHTSYRTSWKWDVGKIRPAMPSTWETIQNTFFRPTTGRRLFKS